jgi:hypothetical protein
VVERDHGVTARQERVDQVAADKTGRAGNECFHGWVSSGVDAGIRTD